MGVLLVKTTLQINETEPLGDLVIPYPEILLTDVFHGKANSTALKQESEIAPFKPRTDITINAVARSPEAKELESWPVRLEVQGRLSYGFHVFGERLWEPGRTLMGRKWKLSSVARMTELPLTYAHAFGGTVKTGEDEETSHAYNPVGRGLLNDYLLSLGEAVPAPQIGLYGEFASLAPDNVMTVCGFGPVTKSWLPRLALAGTFDDAWRHERHPRMPTDYDYAYWNAAPVQLQADPYLQGDETITLTGMRHDPKPYTFKLPNVALASRITRSNIADVEEKLLNLDTVHCDVSDADPNKHHVALVWRLTLPEPDAIENIDIFARRLKGDGA
ncbi:hypothetical protein GCM10011491_10550 [Brucella endophytica]|uniref:DUF2169 domain-containing protein n=1 Tax=Brucella endophytica TaxID=1963359 RepID=A0A916S527_9HYPH|nr:DUF2169 domain-containing protein [Brucella endophytica]GGA84859.1 hypothetical protein GCM10011491_10550 [Brucella endophytica]